MQRPDRCEVWIIDLGLAAKVRPCLVISIIPDESERALVTVIPHTTSIRNSKYEVPVSVPFLKQGVFDTQNIITIPTAKFLRKAGKLNKIDINSVENSIKLWLGL
ncbi:MAG: type II toxin-antitoxin system PemK/MazF family toxin [FCB group bacterium]|jgi:mRNA interferase MazF